MKNNVFLSVVDNNPRATSHCPTYAPGEIYHHIDGPITERGLSGSVGGIEVTFIHCQFGSVSEWTVNEPNERLHSTFR